MKVPPTNPNLPPRAALDAGRLTARKSTSSATNSASAADDAGEPSAAPEGRDFASVLEEVSRPREQQRQESEDEGDHTEARTRDRAEGETEARRREERHGDGGDSRGGGFDGRAAARDAVASQETAAARAILHIADLERIVSAVRAQTLAGGVREITIELRRSVLEGLSVKLALDGAGRVAAEFLASSERVRAQIDARASELAELLRSRGVNLSSLRSSVGADASGRDDSSGRGETSLEGAAAAGTSTAARVVDDLSRADEGDSPGAGDTTTYRA